MTDELLIATGITKSFGSGTSQVSALQNVSLSIQRNEFLSITGPSGSGKSTLLQIMGMMDRPTNGSLVFEGDEVSALDDQARTLLRRRKIGFVFQTFNLLPMLSAVDNVSLPLRLDGISHSEARRRSQEMLDSLGLSSRETHLPSELSGGEQQRVAICRALVTKPSIVFADEPTGSLDSENGNKVMDVFDQHRNEKKHALVIITHDDRIAARAQRRVRLLDGRIVT